MSVSPPPLALPYIFGTAGLRTPTARLDANFQAVADWLNRYGGTVGAIGDRPKPTAVGAIYVASDQHDLWYVADGTAWLPVGRMGQGALSVDPGTGVIRAFGVAAGDGARNVLAWPLATGPVPTALAEIAQLFVWNTQSQDGRASWHQRTEDGWLHPLDRVLYRVVGNPLVTVLNTAVETSLYLQSLDANTLQLGGRTGVEPRGVELTVALDLFNNSGATRVTTLRVKWGGQLLITSALSLTASGTRRKGVMRYRLDPIGATSQVGGLCLSQWDPSPTETHTFTGTTVDPTVAQTLEITMQHAIANGSYDGHLFSARVELG